eukprot:scaffold1549_cov350-Prasinococcus_capsulatus_cf.AAC.4
MITTASHTHANRLQAWRIARCSYNTVLKENTVAVGKTTARVAACGLHTPTPCTSVRVIVAAIDATTNDGCGRRARSGGWLQYALSLMCTWDGRWRARTRCAKELPWWSAPAPPLRELRLRCSRPCVPARVWLVHSCRARSLSRGGLRRTAAATRGDQNKARRDWPRHTHKPPAAVLRCAGSTLPWRWIRGWTWLGDNAAGGSSSQVLEGGGHEDDPSPGRSPSHHRLTGMNAPGCCASCYSSNVCFIRSGPTARSQERSAGPQHMA